jgi:hypothetical protein
MIVAASGTEVTIVRFVRSGAGSKSAVGDAAPGEGDGVAPVQPAAIRAPRIAKTTALRGFNNPDRDTCVPPLRRGRRRFVFILGHDVNQLAIVRIHHR